MIPGLVHDVSATGSTYFIEPMGAVKANNELRELLAQEEKEIERILRELSAECGRCAGRPSSRTTTIWWRLDVIFARGKLSYRMNGHAAPARSATVPSGSAGPGIRCWTKRRRCPLTFAWARSLTPW